MPFANRSELQCRLIVRAVYRPFRQYFSATRFPITCAAPAILTTAVSATLIPATVNAQELLARELLVQMSRQQSSQLCSVKSFTECMAFTEKECLALSEQAIKQCLMPLPEKINPSELENDSIEACPKKVYEDAGFSDEKAKACLLEGAKK